MSCNHTFCCQCFLRSVERHYISDLKCQICSTYFVPGEAVTDEKVEELKNSLVTACKKCGQRFPLRKEKLKVNHEKKCRHSSFQLVDILSVPSASKIPPADSVMPNKSIQLGSGSSRVSKNKIIVSSTFFSLFNLKVIAIRLKC